MDLEYDSVRSASDTMQDWFWRVMILAVLLHVGLFYWFGRIYFEGPDPVQTAEFDPAVAPKFKLERIEIDEAVFAGEVLEGNNEAPSKPVPDVTEVDIPADQQAFQKMLDHVEAMPAAPEMTDSLLQDKPRAIASSMTEAITKVENNTRSLIEDDLQSINQQLLEKPKVKGRSLDDLPGFETAKANKIGLASNLKAETAGENAGPRVGPPGFSDLDELLSQAGPLNRPLAQILMPADLLFAYDSFETAAEAVPSLQKLGLIIQRNPKASITIEGHTDSYGTNEYNEILSQRRALAVKLWLVTYAGIDPRRIETMGYGETKLKASPNGTIEEQQINRRVEIVIRQPKQR